MSKGMKNKKFKSNITRKSRSKKEKSINKIGSSDIDFTSNDLQLSKD
jgi:hypothetical protein